jgi:hypothetical protein
MLIDPTRPWKVIHTPTGSVVGQLKTEAGAAHYAAERIRQMGVEHTIKFHDTDHHPNCPNPDRGTPRSLCPHCSSLA